MRKNWFVVTLGALALALAAPSAHASDHLDGPAVTTDPSTDITDVYTWMQGGKLVLVMNVSPVASATSHFSDSALYVFHVTRRETFVATAATETTIICKFASDTSVTCWPGDEAATTGDASATTGLTSASGKFKVFTGLREDPFFFNLEGFKHARATVLGAAAGLTFDTNGCPALDAPTSAALVGQLSHDMAGGDAVDFFANLNVLSIVAEVDLSLLGGTGNFLGIWGSTHMAP
jgi:hypothetical protein